MMRIILIATAAAGTVLSPSVIAQTQPGGDVNRGRFVAIGGNTQHQRISCVQCHGIDGVGNTSGAFPRLADQSGWYLYKSLQDYASGLRPNEIMMPIAQTLTDREMQDVAAYYASIQNAPYPAKPEADVQTLQIGGAISAVGIPSQGVPPCSGCHGQDGVGASPIYPALAGQYAPYTEYQLLLWKQGHRDGDPMNIMEQIAKAMTEEQIRAVSLYFAAVRPSELTPSESSISSSAPPAASIPTSISGNPTSVGATPQPRPNPGTGVVPDPAGDATRGASPPYLPQPGRPAPNMTTTGQRPDTTR